MKVDAPDRITKHDEFIIRHHPSAKWIISWLDEGTSIRVAFERARDAAERSCQHDFHMRDLHTYIAFDTYEDAMLTYLALV